MTYKATAEQATTLMCDLCSEVGGIAWTYLTRNAGGPVVAEDPEWAVCDPCHQIIRTGTVVDLVTRSVELQFRNMLVIGDDDGKIRKDFINSVVDIHTGFWSTIIDHWPEPGHNIEKA